jgi:hypothetical protein
MEISSHLPFFTISFYATMGQYSSRAGTSARTIKAKADSVPGETERHIADNNCTDGWVLVAKVGDLGGGVPQCSSTVMALLMAKTWHCSYSAIMA